MYGQAQAKISIGYEYTTCVATVWETQTATLAGFDVDISDIGGWGLDIHHHYNFHEGILQKGDGALLHLKQYPRTVQVNIQSDVFLFIEITWISWKTSFLRFVQ